MLKKLLEERPAFPEEISRLVQGALLYDSSCSENAKVYYADNGLFVKTAASGTLAHEARMGSIFARRKLGPEVVCYRKDEMDWLVTKEVPGQDLTHFLDRPALLCRRMGERLRELHAQRGKDMPEAPAFALYEQAIARGVKTANFQRYVLLNSFAITTEEEAFVLASENRSALKRDVLIHGDACLPNMMMAGDKITSFIDFSASGAGDRHVDLFWAVWSLAFNLKTERYADAFLDAYGREAVDNTLLRTVAALEALG